MPQKSVLLIDMMNLFIAQFSANQTLDESGKHVGGLFGCIRNIISSINKFNADIVICVWDGIDSGRKKRMFYKDYKSGRRVTGFNKLFEGKPNEETKSIEEQLIKLKHYVDLMPIYQLSIEHVEADDVIAHIVCGIFNDEDHFCNTVLTTDKDYFQIINKNTIVYRPIKNSDNSHGQLMDTNAVIKKYGLHPNGFLLYKCFDGDSSDNIKGIKGIGIKTLCSDLSFLSEQNAKFDNSYTVDDLLSYVHDKLSIENDGSKQTKKQIKTYQKYNDTDMILHLRDNYYLMHLPFVDMSLDSKLSIERNLSNHQIIKFNSTMFSVELIKDKIFPEKHIGNWNSTLNSIHMQQIQIL